MDKIVDWVRAGQIDAAIQYTENKLAELPETGFHQIIGKDLLHLQPILGQFLHSFFKSMREEEELDIKAVFCEMNAFTVNYDLWFLDLFAYETVEEEDTLNWLAEYDGQSEKSLTVTGFEALQEVNKAYMESEGYRDDNQQAACELHEYLVILRLQQLFKQTASQHKNKATWAGIPMFVTAHDYEDMIYVVMNR
ncbi:hypothetical protein GFS24_03445 [Chitinophaga sp. SYP-B3965]|uniref:hypothetical protein n=1 Tax=Chitinophaga sp. SYP-B3965 TaxID=2663120 RepID=UPI001299D45A|nr:hypothetical protein [Chitinophaga sp. SYP-B3965]MRG44150.1 hypothetical protein [Chitinophaga sp. SYP-B3965]